MYLYLDNKSNNNPYSIEKVYDAIQITKIGVEFHKKTSINQRNNFNQIFYSKKMKEENIGIEKGGSSRKGADFQQKLVT